MLKGQKGITLVALVVTIIVLIILAGVSIAIVLGDNGLVERTKTAANMQKEATANEEGFTNYVVDYINSQL